MGGFGDTTGNYSVAIRVNRVMLVSLWTETMKLVEGNASVYQVKPVSRITGEGRVGGGGVNSSSGVEAFITQADFDVGRLGERGKRKGGGVWGKRF